AGDAAASFTPEAGQRRAGDLDYASLFRPLRNALWIFPQDRVALGMSDDHGHSVVPQLAKRIGHLLGDAVVAELHQQIARLADHVARGMGKSVLHVIVREMEIAPQADPGRIAYQLLQMLDQALQVIA